VPAQRNKDQLLQGIILDANGQSVRSNPGAQPRFGNADKRSWHLKTPSLNENGSYLIESSTVIFVSLLTHTRPIQILSIVLT
jgi:hypothetical protein